jgi:hypothetical protein
MLKAISRSHKRWPARFPCRIERAPICLVSHLIPTIHPYFQICDPGIVTHSPEFAVAAAPRADEALFTGAVLLARTGADVLPRADLRDRIRTSFRGQLGREPQA